MMKCDKSCVVKLYLFALLIVLFMYVIFVCCYWMTSWV